MPVQPDPQAIQGWPNQVNIPTQDQRFFLSIQVQTDGTPSQEDQDQFLQELIDYFQEWPGRLETQDVTGSRYQSWLYLVTPTNPIPPPDPPEEEPVNP